jgi:hypothetical protein
LSGNPTYQELTFWRNLHFMKVAGPLLVTFVVGAFLAATLLSQDRSTQQQCIDAPLSFSLKAGNTFQQPISDLIFKLQPLESTGWMFSLEDAKGHDFLYPVNPPLRLNAAQTLGAGYGSTAKQSLSYGRELRFLLNESEYRALWPYVEHALWPYDAPDPSHAADEYFSELDKLRTGLLSLAIIRSDISESDEVRSAEFHVEFIAPASFHFDPSLEPHIVTCPASTLPLRQQLPARIPQPQPAEYRNVQDAGLWKNPFLTITRDGFDLRFQGGRMFGPLSVLARTLVGLPDSAWPYGRVIAGAESGLRATGNVDDALIKSNREEADKILRALGLVVDWWPAA